MTLALYRTSLAKDKVILLNSEPGGNDPIYENNEKKVLNSLNESGIRNVEIVRIDPYDYIQIMESLDSVIIREKQSHHDCWFHFNITSGSNMVVGSMCATAQMIPNADIYHLREGRYCTPPQEEGKIVQMEIGDLENVRSLEAKETTRKVFLAIDDYLTESNTNSISNSTLAEKSSVNGSLLTYHTKELTKSGLIIKGGNPLEPTDWSLTAKGTQVLKRLRIRAKLRGMD